METIQITHICCLPSLSQNLLNPSLFCLLRAVSPTMLRYELPRPKHEVEVCPHHALIVRNRSHF